MYLMGDESRRRGRAIRGGQHGKGRGEGRLEQPSERRVSVGYVRGAVGARGGKSGDDCAEDRERLVNEGPFLRSTAAQLRWQENPLLKVAMTHNYYRGRDVPIEATTGHNTTKEWWRLKAASTCRVRVKVMVRVRVRVMVAAHGYVDMPVPQLYLQPGAARARTLRTF